MKKRDMPTIENALHAIAPGANWSVRYGETDQEYEIIWLDEKQNKPTETQISQKLEELSNSWEASLYAVKRKDEYPPLSEFADAFYWHLQGDDTKMSEYQEKVAAVKEKYPKPGAAS